MTCYIDLTLQSFPDSHSYDIKHRHIPVNRFALIMPSKMEVASQHCDTAPNKKKDTLESVKIERIFKHDSRARHPVQSSARGTLDQ